MYTNKFLMRNCVLLVMALYRTLCKNLPHHSCHRIRFGSCLGQKQSRLFIVKGTVFVMSSVREGLPNVVLEAMASALPVVGTAIGGIPELVQEGITGHLVPQQDPPSMASAIISLLRDPAKASAMGRAGQEIIQKKFSLSAAISAHLALFDSFL